MFVRINPLTVYSVVDELREFVQPALAGAVVPKIATPNDIVVADRLLSWCEHERGMSSGSVAMVPRLETATAMRAAFDIAGASRRVSYLGGLAVAGGDIEGAVGYRWTPQDTETLSLRSHIRLDTRAAGVHNPVSGLWSEVANHVDKAMAITARRRIGALDR